MDKDLPIELSNDELVINEIERSGFGAFGIYLTTIIITISCLIVAYIIQDGSVLGSAIDQSASIYLSLGVAILGLLSLIFGYVAANIYWENRMFITNESIHQVVRRGFFDKSRQHILLSRVESAKYNQRTMFQRLFNYGTLVFATEGNDIDYVMLYVKNPSRYPRIFHDAQENYIRNMTSNNSKPYPT